MKDPFDDVTETIPLLDLADQRRVIYQASIREAIEVLQANADAPVVPSDFDDSPYGTAYLLERHAGWQPPAPELLRHWCQQLKVFDDRWTQRAIAEELLGIDPRRLREYLQGKHAIPFELCRKLLVVTGRAPQHVAPVIAFFE